MAINRPVDKFSFCCPYCRIVTERAGKCPICGRETELMRQGYIAAFLGDTVLKTEFPTGVKIPADLKDFPWMSVSFCRKCGYSTHNGDICPKHRTALKKEIVKLGYACKKDRFLFTGPVVCPECKREAISVTEVHAAKYAINEH